MARILHVGNFSLKAKGAFQHSVEHKLSNGLIRNGHQVVNFSDRDAARAGSVLGRSKFGGRGAANKSLRSLCRHMGPDVVLFGQADVIAAETIAAIRQDSPSIRILQWNVDPMFETNNVARLLSKTEVVHATLVSTAGEALALLKRPGMLLGFLPNPVDFSIERGRCHEVEHLPYDLFYACGNPSQPLREVAGIDWDMNEYMARLLAKLPDARVLAPGIAGAPHLAGAAYQAGLEQAALGLNISRRDDNFLYSSDRLAHMCGNGQAILIARTVGYDTLFSDEEMVFFDGMDDLAEKIAALIAEPRRRMTLAAAGRARYHALFNEQRVAKYVLEVALGDIDPADYPWPTLLQ
ncbi:glycosyltransferase family protein [Phenylobacterium montanum]|uniref:Glycosyltransferase family 1 protein n=1 Tax=Phenylobacterium montanum TaxID=2823693 RepID=A0A975IVD8_9CAUL|nr:glycosyltransferase [Caulobacter sp. S6]QUD87211.1 glycosyltransferase family 1 protein [Caulobacter sp. S6]